MVLFLVRLTWTILFSLSGNAPRPGNFQIIGPGGGGAMFHPTISPHDPNTVLLSCDMTGSYISHDGGQSWRMFSLRGVVRFFVFDPQDPKVLYAQADGLWRSRDRDRKSTRLNSSHLVISYAVFCLKKKTKDDRI